MTKKDTLTIYQNIKFLCSKNNLCISALEKELGLSAGYFSRIAKLNMRADTLYQISKKFNVSMNDLIEKHLNKEERIKQLKAELKELESED